MSNQFDQQFKQCKLEFDLNRPEMFEGILQKILKLIFSKNQSGQYPVDQFMGSGLLNYLIVFLSKQQRSNNQWLKAASM